ncbi:hypothetical protein FACS1894180_7930 [Bacteroidia bacterium]|nr:hypothetical protein FACS1894180_7930 [Bacteroidia bacterium]
MKKMPRHISRAAASKPLLLRAVCVVVGLGCAVNTYGAMTKDLNKGIQSITYNELSLPLKIEIATLALGGTNEYKYTSTGIKLHVTHNWNANINGSVIGGSSAEQRQETDYIGNKIYENGKLKMILTDNGYIQDGEYFFYIKDHLGNNRIVVNESGHIVQSTDYYPYGLPTPDAVSTETQPYKYNGKELDNISGLNLYDYSARHYDPVIGSFTTVDPLAEKTRWLSPYVFCSNSPINRIDPNGLSDYVITDVGQIVLARKTDDKTDRLFSYTDGKHITVSDKSILQQLSESGKGYEHAAAETKNPTDALSVFKFASENSLSEWSVAKFKDGTSILNTNFSPENVENETFFGQKDFNLSYHIHSHPGMASQETSHASHYLEYFNNIIMNPDKRGSDALMMVHYFNAAKSINRKWPSDYPKLFIFEPSTGKMYNYNHKSSSEYVGKPANAKQMRALINNFKFKP